MTRVYYQTGRLRARMIAYEMLVLAVFVGANLAAYSYLFAMPMEQVWNQAVSISVLVALAFLALATYTFLTLRPMVRLLEDLRDHGVSPPEREAEAGRAALRFPLSFTALSLAIGAVGTFAGLAVDIWIQDMPPTLAVGIACATVAVVLVLCAFIYLVARSVMRPVVAHTRHEQVPSGIRLPIRAKVSYAIVALCLAVSIPTALICSAQLDDTQARDWARRRGQLAEAIAYGGEALGIDGLRDAIATIHLSGGSRIRFREGLSPGASPVRSADDGPGYVEVAAGAAGNHHHSFLIVLAALLLSLAIFVGRSLGSTISQDMRMLSGRIRLLSEALMSPPEGPAQTLRPLIAEAPQFSDLRRLADALNALLDRIVEITVTHFLAIEKTLEADRVKTQFLANFSHDLRSPLNSILGFSQLLLRDAHELTAQQKRDLEIIHRCGNELLVLINQVLDAAKLDAGRLTLHREDSLPADLLRQAVKEARGQGIPEGVQLETELQPGMQAVAVDPQRMVQVMAGIILFCVRSIERGRVVVKLTCGTAAASNSPSAGEEDRRYLRFGAATTAGGMPQPQVRRLFRGFRRRPGRRGLGLELSLARALVDLHEGTMEVHSAVGVGTTFTVEIPLLQPKVLARLRPRKPK
jgi:signal transduction histidine kinase